MSSINYLTSESNWKIFQPIAKTVQIISERITNIFKKMIEPLAGYFLKMCIFQNAAFQSPFSKRIVGPCVRGVLNLWQKCQNIPLQRSAFDQNRLDRSARFLAEFGEIKKLRTADGTEIEYALFRPERFREWIAQNGTEKLQQFKAFPSGIPEALPGAQERCILRCQGFGRSIPMDKEMIGIHLAYGFNYAVFNWRENISAKGVFEDAEAVYQLLLSEGFAPQQIKAMGSCRATFVIGRLKELHHAEGLDAVMIHAPPSLRAVIQNQMWPANKIGLAGIGAIEKEAHFDTLRRLRELQPAEAGTCIIMSEGDKTLPDTTTQNLFEAAQRAGYCDLILEPKKKNGEDPHFGEPLRNPDVLRRYLAFLMR
jgi:hypothetical protein